MSDLDDVLAHYGVKGMKWGVTRKRDSSDGSLHVVESRTPKGQIKLAAKGRKADGAHEDAVKAALTKHVAKKSGTHALSNKELQHVVTRMNLEQQYSKLSNNKKKKVPGQKFVAEIVSNIGKTQATKVGNDAAAKKIASMMAKMSK